MKRTIIAALTFSLLASTAALADPPPWAGHDHGNRDRHEWRHEDHDRGHWRREDHERWRHEDRDHWRRDDDRGEHHWVRFDSDRYRRPPGYYYRVWVRGDRLPSAYRAPEYVVPDTVAYHLAPPPPGYCWIRVDNRAVLAAIATGVVLDVVNDAFR